MLPSGTITIQDLRNEVYGGGGGTDLATYGQLWFGRNNCSLSEFRGRSWSKTVNVGAFPQYDRTGTWYSLSIDTGSLQYQNYGADGISITNTALWSRFNRVELQGAGTVAKSQFSWNGSYYYFAIGWNPAGYTALFYFDKT